MHINVTNVGLSLSSAHSQRLVGLAWPWNNLPMTTTVDREHRAVTPFQPGDVIEVEQQSPDIVMLKRTKHAQIAQPRLERKNGRLIFVGEALATDDVKRLLEDFP
jgi:hypothetical protein